MATAKWRAYGALQQQVELAMTSHDPCRLLATRRALTFVELLLALLILGLVMAAAGRWLTAGLRKVEGLQEQEAVLQRRAQALRLLRLDCQYGDQDHTLVAENRLVLAGMRPEHPGDAVAPFEWRLHDGLLLRLQGDRIRPVDDQWQGAAFATDQDGIWLQRGEQRWLLAPAGGSR